MQYREGTLDGDFSPRCVQHLVEERATERPNAVAIETGSQLLTYRELNDRAATLACHLRACGVGPDVPVAVCIKSSIAMVVGALAALKAGGAYLPLDPAYPARRLSGILDDAGVPVLLTARGIAGSLPSGAWRTFELDCDGQCSDPPASVGRSAHPVLSNLAYVIYTSGSTGQPKGVEVEHRSLLNLIDWHQRAFSITANDRATQIAGVGFDAAVWEIWPYLTAGASVHIPDERVRTDPESLRDWLVAEDITTTFLPTALVERIMKLEWPSETRLRLVFTGGDTLHHFPSRGLPFALVNNYGPTEGTVVATSAVVPPLSSSDQRPGIGRPITNARVYILNEDLMPVPAGIPGELYIGGPGVARGYRNCPDLNRTKFIADPFSVEPGARIYKTGDRARLLPDGQIAFIGRIDDQIKVRGYRIEPNEIVSALNHDPDICESAVIGTEDASGETKLVAYIVTQPTAQLTHSDLRERLRNDLPEYMIPSTFVRMERLPLTTHGKIDRASLPSPNVENALGDNASAAPRSPVEERVAVLLRDLLSVNSIGTNDNFFHLGGHSLLGAQVIARVRDIFEVELSLRSIFDHPTVEGISAEIESLILNKIQNLTDDEAQSMLGHEPETTAA